MKKVLIVDDNTDFLDMLTLLLGRSYQVVTCASMEEVVEQLGTFTPDAVLLDQHVRDRSAEEVIHVLLGHGLAAVPVVLITGGENAQEEAERLKCAHYLVKPFSNALLKSTLENVLKD